MSGWPWPLDGVQRWFEELWNHIIRQQQNAIISIATQNTNTATSLWTNISNWLSQLWSWISSAFNNLANLWTAAQNIIIGLISGALSGLWSNIVGGLSQLWSWVGPALNNLWSAIQGFANNVASWIERGFSGLWTNLVSFADWLAGSIEKGIGDLGAAVGKWAGDTWDNFLKADATRRLIEGNLHTDIGKNAADTANAVLNAVGNALGTVGNWIAGVLKGIVEALGKGLQEFLGWVWSGLAATAGVVVNALNEYVVRPLLGAFDWIRDRVTDILRSFYNGVAGLFSGVGMGTPEGAAALGVPLLLVSTGGSFALGAMGAIAGLKVVGTGVESGAVVDCLRDAFSLAEISKSVFQPIIAAAYTQPIQYFYNAMFRPRIPDTRTADQMLFEQHINEPEWRQIYRYNGWKEQHIDAWFKTMWREPSQLILRNMVMDPDTDPEWLRKKYREIGFVGEDLDAMLDYGRRQALRDERSALATQTQTDYIDGVITEADARGDLAALKFSPPEIDYRIVRCQLITERNARRAALAAAKKLTESDLEKEVALGLRTHDQFVQDMQTIGNSVAIAERKYALIITSKPLSAEEIERRKTVIQDRIVKANRRYDMLIARHDLQVGLIADTIDYLSGLEKPPETRIATLMLQLGKMADEKQLLLQERDAELADLGAELSLGVAGWRQIEAYRDWTIWQWADQPKYEARRPGWNSIGGVDLPDLKADVAETYR